MDGKRVLIIGAVALGPKVACRLKRLRPDMEVIMVDQDEHISYGGCGIPYFVSGEISDIQELMSTSFHMLRSPKFFQDTKDVTVRPLTRALAIDRKAQKVRVLDLNTNQEEEIPYDRLVLGTGSRPNRLPIPGIDHPRVMSVFNPSSAMAIREYISKGEVDRAVIIGAGAIGCEMAEALSDLWGVETTVVEIMDQVLPGVLDRELAVMVRKHLEEHEVTVHLGESVQEIRSGESDEQLQVVTSERVLDADLVITAVGVHPNGRLAAEAGLTMSPRGAIVVNQRLETSDPNIYAGGDCIENHHLITGRPVFFPQGSLANRHGRVIGTNLAGGFATFPGVVGSFSVKIFDLAVATAGLTLKGALREGFDAVHAFVVQADRAHFYPTQDFMYISVVADRKTRRLLGAQGVGHNGDAIVGRINAIAALLSSKATVADLSNLEIAYSPPFAAAMDVVNAAANTLENTLDGLNTCVTMEEFEKNIVERKVDGVICLDVRSPSNAAPFLAQYGDRWVNIPQETLKYRMAEVPKDKRLYVLCNSGVRSYEALRQLHTAGIPDALNVEGGVVALKKAGTLQTESSETDEA